MRGQARYDAETRIPALTRKEQEMADRKLWFVHFAQWASHITGRPLTFMLALASIVVWAMLGPFFGFSDTWHGRIVAHLDIGVPFFFLLSAFLLYRPFVASRRDRRDRRWA